MTNAQEITRALGGRWNGRNGAVRCVCHDDRTPSLSIGDGDRGIVVLTFRIMRNGDVAVGDPVIQRNSGKEPLDRAAFSSIRASNPFEPLPPQFSGPYIELRYTYLYNIPPEEWPR